MALVGMRRGSFHISLSFVFVLVSKWFASFMASPYVVHRKLNDFLINDFCNTGRSGRRSRKQQLRYPRQYKRSYDPYDSHNEDECSHCDKHLPGEHSDCCPRYIDASQANGKIGADDEDEMEISRNGAPPKRRHIEPLESRNKGELDSEDDLHLLDEDLSRNLNDSQAADDTTYLRRPQSTTGSLRLASVRSVRSK